MICPKGVRNTVRTTISIEIRKTRLPNTCIEPCYWTTPFCYKQRTRLLSSSQIFYICSVISIWNFIPMHPIISHIIICDMRISYAYEITLHTHKRKLNNLHYTISAIHNAEEILGLSGWIERHIFRISVFLISWPTSFQFLVIPIANKGFHNFKEQIFSFERVRCVSKILFQRHFLSSTRSCASCILGFTSFVMSLLRDVVYISIYVALVADLKKKKKIFTY
jgi:hypothetical protein